LGQLPISLRSDALLKKKKDLEDRLERVDNAIHNFSRKIVYMKD